MPCLNGRMGHATRIPAPPGGRFGGRGQNGRACWERTRVTIGLGGAASWRGPWRPCGPDGSWLRRRNQAREEEFARDSPSQWAGGTGAQGQFPDYHQQVDLSSDYGHSLLHLNTAMRLRSPRQLWTPAWSVLLYSQGSCIPHPLVRHTEPLPALAPMCVVGSVNVCQVETSL